MSPSTYETSISINVAGVLSAICILIANKAYRGIRTIFFCFSGCNYSCTLFCAMFYIGAMIHVCSL